MVKSKKKTVKKNKLENKMLLLSFITLICLLVFSVSVFLMLSRTNRSKEPNPLVVLETTMGEIELSLDRTRAPISVDNFLSYVEEGYYDGTLIHQVSKGRFVEGGVYNPNFYEKPTHEPIILESNNGLINRAWTIGFGHLEEPNSATNGFYINLADNPDLDYNPPLTPGYAVFGNVSSGFDTLSLINSTPTITLFKQAGWPAENIIIMRAYRKK